MTGPKLVRVTDSFEGTVAELLDWCAQHDLAPEAVTLPGCHLKYDRPRTEEEAARLAQFQAERDARRDEWERETYARLKAKFEGP